MDQMVTMESALALFCDGDYGQALTQLEALPASPRQQIYVLAARGLSCHPVKGTALASFWDDLRPLLQAEPSWDLLEEGRQVLSIFANTVFRNCNDWQKLEYAKLQGDVSLEKKEYLFREFQRVLLAADVEYRAVLYALYGYAALADARYQDQAPEAFRLGALKNMQQIGDLQYQIGLQEEYDPMVLAYYACRMKLEVGSEEDSLRRDLLDTVLTGEKALEQWDAFQPYANPAKKKELEKQVRRAHVSEKLKFWKRIKASIHK